MTPDAAGRPERSDLTVDQHRMVAPSRVWLMPPPGAPTWYAGSWKSNPLTVVVGDVPYTPESEVTRLRAEVEALAAVVTTWDVWEEHRRSCTYGYYGDCTIAEELQDAYDLALTNARALLAARKEDEG